VISTEQIVARLARAIDAGDIAAVMQYLSRRVRAHGDMTTEQTIGRLDVARLLRERLAGELGVQSVNGSPGIVARRASVTVAVMCPTVRLGLVTSVWLTSSPDRLRHFNPVTDAPDTRS